jgi:hypothetical protein
VTDITARNRNNPIESACGEEVVKGKDRKLRTNDGRSESDEPEEVAKAVSLAHKPG